MTNPTYATDALYKYNINSWLRAWQKVQIFLFHKKKKLKSAFLLDQTF